MQNKIAGLLMESGAPFNKEKLHGKKYFAQLLKDLQEVPESVKDLLRLSRGALEMFQATQKRPVHALLANPELGQHVERLASIQGIGEITALTWALEVGDPFRFSSSAAAMSYCGLTSALKSSATNSNAVPFPNNAIAGCKPPWGVLSPGQNVRHPLLGSSKLEPRVRGATCPNAQARRETLHSSGQTFKHQAHRLLD